MVKKLKKLKIPFVILTILVVSISTLLISSAASNELPDDIIIDVPAGKRVEVVTSKVVPAFFTGKAYINFTSEKLDVPVMGYLYYSGESHTNKKITGDMFFEPDEVTAIVSNCRIAFSNCDVGIGYKTGDANYGDHYNVATIPSYTETDGAEGILYILALVDGPGVLEVIMDLFVSLGEWLSESLGYLIPMFWLDGKLTFLGMLCIVPLAFSVIFLIIGIIQNFLRFGG